MIDVESTIQIARPPAEVFAFVADQTNAPKWQADLYEVRRLTDGPIGVGTEHEFVRKFAGRTLASRNRYVAFEEGTFFEFEIPEGWLTGKAFYRATPSGDGTALTSGMHFSARGPLKLFEPILTRLLARDSNKADETLKRMLESSPRA